MVPENAASQAEVAAKSLGSPDYSFYQFLRKALNRPYVPPEPVVPKSEQGQRFRGY